MWQIREDNLFQGKFIKAGRVVVLLQARWEVLRVGLSGLRLLVL